MPADPLIWGFKSDQEFSSFIHWNSYCVLHMCVLHMRTKYFIPEDPKAVKMKTVPKCIAEVTVKKANLTFTPWFPDPSFLAMSKTRAAYIGHFSLKSEPKTKTHIPHQNVVINTN